MVKGDIACFFTGGYTESGRLLYKINTDWSAFVTMYNECSRPNL